MPVNRGKVHQIHTAIRRFCVFRWTRRKRELSSGLKKSECIARSEARTLRTAGSSSLVPLETKSNKELSEGGQVLSSPQTQIHREVDFVYGGLEVKPGMLYVRA